MRLFAQWANRSEGTSARCRSDSDLRVRSRLRSDALPAPLLKISISGVTTLESIRKADQSQLEAALLGGGAQAPIFGAFGGAETPLFRRFCAESRNFLPVVVKNNEQD